MHHSKVPSETFLTLHKLLKTLVNWLDWVGACRKRGTSTGSVYDPEAAFIQEYLLVQFDHAQSCSSSFGDLGKYERYSKGKNYALGIWVSWLVSKMSVVLISDLMA